MSRLYNMDLERVLLIFLVIVLHFNNRDMGGALNAMSGGIIPEVIIRLGQSLAICAVDSFVISSGYFAAFKKEHAGSPADAGTVSSVPWRKALWLLAVCSFYRTVGYVLYVAWITHDFSPRVLVGYMIPNNWFVCLFVTLLLLSPYIDHVLAAGSLSKPVCILCILFSVVPTAVSIARDLAGVDLNGLSTVTWQGDGSGFNIGLFVFMYCLGYALRAHRDYWDRFHPLFYLATYMLASCLTAAVSRITESIWNYSSVTVVLEAAMLTLMFTRIRIGSEHAGRVISAVGGCSLGIFVWHTMPLMIFGLWSRFDIPSSFIAATLTMYALSFVWVFSCRTAAGFIRRRLRPADR